MCADSSYLKNTFSAPDYLKAFLVAVPCCRLLSETPLIVLSRWHNRYHVFLPIQADKQAKHFVISLASNEMCPLLPFSIYRNGNLKPQILAFPSNSTSIDIPVVLSLVSLSPLLLSDLYLSFYFLSHLEVFYATFHLGLTSLETDG